MAKTQGEKVDDGPKAPAVSYEQLQQINTNLSKQNQIAKTVLMQVASQLHNMGMTSLNISDNIAQMFAQPTPQEQQKEQALQTIKPQ